MKLTLLALVILTTGLFATEVKSQTARVTLSMHGVETSKILDAIEKQTDYLFLYSPNEVNLSEKSSIEANNQTVAEVLSTLFRNSGIVYAVEGTSIMLMKREASPEKIAQQSGRRITGMVTDASGEPIIGANIMEKGTSNGVITDLNGEFTIQVAEGAVLQITYIGYTAQEIKVGDRSSYSIQLREDALALEEIVVVGYGVQKKQTMTAAASVMKMDDITSTASTNLESTLGGRVSGVLIQQQSGEAGYEEPKIIIRGSSSPTSSKPLIVVDGVIGRSMSQLDPNEIQSLTVLKDASAVAPYGARGANGVILIKTKRGTQGRTLVNYNFKVGFGEPTRLPEIASSYDHARMMNVAWRNKEMDLGNDPGMYGMYSEEELNKFRDGSDPYGYPNTNWQKEVLLPRAWQQQHSLTASGGNDKVQYFVGFGYVNQDALYGDVRTGKSSTGFNRYNVRSNIDANIIDKWLTVSADISLRQEDRNTIASSTEFIFQNMYRNPQTDPGRFPDGKLGKVSLGHNAIGLVSEGGYKRLRRSVVNTNFAVNFTIPGVDGLSFRGVFAFDKWFEREKLWETPINYYVWNKILNQYDSSSPNREGSDLKEGFEQEQSYTAEFQANYNTRIGKDHQIGALFVYTVTEDKGDKFSAMRYKYQFSSIPQLFAGPDKDKSNTGEAKESGKIGTVFRLTYNYKEKYMVEANGRIDGSEKFPKNKRFGFFPSVSLAWRVSAEPFMQPVEHIVNNLKLRTSWGKAGTDEIGRFRYRSAYGVGDNAVFGGQNPEIGMGYTENRFPNPDITWETSEMFNIGVDASFFNSRLVLEADYFYKVTSDILLARTDMPGMLGYKLPAANVGVVDNRGIDLSITHQNQLSDLSYAVTGNLTWARNKIIDLVEPAGKKNNPRSRKTGHPMEQFFGYEALGLFQTDGEADNWPQMQFGQSKAGDVKYKDQNGDGIIDAEDIVAIGRTPFPELIFGLNLAAEYKGFDLGVFFQGAALTSHIYGGYLAHPYAEGQGSVLFNHHINNSWSSETPNAEFPRLYYGGSPVNREESTFWLRDASYLRLKNIELGYNLKSSLLARTNVIQRCRIYLAAQNVFTWSKLKYLDPEARGNEIYPQMKNYTLGVNITF